MGDPRAGTSLRVDSGVSDAAPKPSRRLDDAPGVVGVTRDELPVLPDEALTNPVAGRVDPRRWFRDPARPLDIEVGPGRGSFLVQQAQAEPGVNFLGIEWEPEIYFYCSDRVRRRGLVNVRLLRGDAAEFLRWRCPDGLVRAVHLYFSDPWPKKKHHKNRVIQDRFLAEVHRVLVPGGELRVATDHDELWAWDLEHFARVTGDDPGPARFTMKEFIAPEWAEDGELLGTNYERKMCAGVKRPHACTLQRIDPGSSTGSRA